MATTSTTKKILTIDDEKAIVELIVDILEANDYTAISATQWTDALDALNHEDPDLVLLDLKMPTIHGTSMLKFLRREGFTVPIIVVSGFVTESVASELQKQGVNGIVCKPFKASYLIEQVEKVLGQKTKPPAPQNALDALYNRPPAPVPEPDASGSPAPSMDALYGDADKMDRKNMLFFGGITVVCLLLAGFLMVMQYLANEAPMTVERIKAEGEGILKKQVNQEVQERPKEQQQQIQQQPKPK